MIPSILCTCGHVKQRHLFREGQCLHSSKQEGDTVRHCRCKGFTEPAARKPQVDYDLGTTTP